MSDEKQQAVFAAGCFWGVEARFSAIKGVLGTRVGYTGGRTAEPSYAQVCSGRTGHAEAVLVEFDPKQVTYDELLEVFFSCHDPTQRNRQGWDIGTQYRSAIFYQTPLQKEQAERQLAHVAQSLARPIATEITQATNFYEAEDYHQNYLAKKTGASRRKIF